MSILSIIPARGGSKGIPDKNIKPLCGKPLIVHTIEASVKCGKISRTIVSTDSPEIAEISKNYGAEVPFLRPKELSGDNAPSIDAVIHCLEFLKEQENYIPDFVCLLQCTSPLRNETHISEAVDLITQKGVKSVVSVCKSDKSPYWAKVINRGGFLEDFIGSGQSSSRRQDLPDVYDLNGAIYINSVNIVINDKKLISGVSYPYVMDKLVSFDIDDAVDFDICEYIMHKQSQEGLYAR